MRAVTDASVVRLGGGRVGGSVRAWVRGGVTLPDLFPPDGDPDHALCGARLIKDQRKVTLGVLHAGGGIGPMYVKRYNVPSLRARLSSLVQLSPALRALAGTATLNAAGFDTAPALAAVEYRRWVVLQRSFFVTEQVSGAVPADQYWWSLRLEPRASRRAFIARLARLFASLHAAGVYHDDLKDANVLVRRAGRGDDIDCFLLDLEGVGRRRTLSRRRRAKNLVQLHRTLGRLTTTRDNLYFLRVYLEALGHPPGSRRRWRRRVAAAVRRKDLRHGLRALGGE